MDRPGQRHETPGVALHLRAPASSQLLPGLCSRSQRRRLTQVNSLSARDLALHAQQGTLPPIVSWPFDPTAHHADRPAHRDGQQVAPGGRGYTTSADSKCATWPMQNPGDHRPGGHRRQAPRRHDLPSIKPHYAGPQHVSRRRHDVRSHRGKSNDLLPERQTSRSAVKDIALSSNSLYQSRRTHEGPPDPFASAAGAEATSGRSPSA